jgi:hypothetical protein
VGGRVGAEVVKVLLSAEPGRVRPVAAATRTVRIPRRQPSAESLRKCRDLILSNPNGTNRTTDWTFAKERLVLDYLIQKQPVVDVEVQAIQIGPAVFLANPAEFFCQLGLDIKAGSRFPFTFVVELANGGVGYVPDEAAFSRSGGGYETVLTSYSNLEPTAGRQIVAASLELADALRPGSVPRGPRIRSKGERWGYGALGPELD